MDNLKLGTLRFIYADDNRPMHLVMPELISKAFPDYIILCKSVYNGQSLLDEILSLNNLAGIITDYDMPEKTGSHALLEARQQGYSAPAIIVTGSSSNPELKRDLKTLTDVPVLLKPFTTDDFINVSRHHWRKYSPKIP